MMLSEDVRFDGFSSSDWTRLVSLFRPDGGAARTLVVVVDEDDAVLNAHVLGEGLVDVGETLPEGRDALRELTARFAAGRTLVLREGAMEEIAERLALAYTAADEYDYVAQWRSLARAATEVRAAGGLRTHPPLPRAPLPNVGALRRALDLILPRNHSVVLVAYEDGEVHTAIAVSRRRDGIDRVAGPERLREWCGPLSGDHHRDQRIFRDAVGRHMAPVHLGIYCERELLATLLRAPDPGDWITAAATRELVLQPTPAFVGVALAADGVRSLARASADLLGGFDVLGALRPVTNTLRQQLPDLDSLSAVLGFNPLAAISRFLRREAPDGGTDDD